MAIAHLVQINWVDDMDSERIAAFSAALDKLRTEIPAIRSFRFGPNLGLDGSTSDYVIYAEFDSVADYLTYRDHPAHEAFRAEHLSGSAKSRSAAQLEIHS